MWCYEHIWISFKHKVDEKTYLVSLKLNNMSFEMSTLVNSPKNTLKNKPPLSSNDTNHDRVSATLNFSFACAEKLYLIRIYRSSVQGVYCLKKGIYRHIDRYVTLVQGAYLLLVSLALLKFQTNTAASTGPQTDISDAFLLKFVSYSYLSASISFWVSKTTCSCFANDVLCMLNSIFNIKKRKRKGQLLDFNKRNKSEQNLQITLSYCV